MSTEASTETTETNTETAEGSEVTEANEAKVETETKPDDVTETLQTLKEEVAHWKKFSRKHENNADNLLAEKTEWEKEKETFQNTLTKLQNELDEKSSALEKITVETLKNKIAKDFGLPEKAVSFLKGKTEDELAAEAETLAEITGTKTNLSPIIRTQGQQSGTIASDPIEALKQWQAKALKK